MDRDQERFYQEAEQDQDQGVRQAENGQGQQDDEVNDMRYYLELLRILRNGLESGVSVPLTGKRLVDADELLMVVTDLEKNLPDAVQYGLQMYSQKDQFLSRAKQTAMDHISSAEMRANAAVERARKDAEQRVVEAENEANAILEDAQERADHLLDESEILRKAREEARIVVNEARVEANEMRLKAKHEAYKMLSSVEEQLTEACKNVRRRRSEFGDENE